MLKVQVSVAQSLGVFQAAVPQKLLEAVLNQVVFLHLNPIVVALAAVTNLVVVLVAILNQAVFLISLTHLLLHLQNPVVKKLAVLLLSPVKTTTMETNALFYQYPFLYFGETTTIRVTAVS